MCYLKKIFLILVCLIFIFGCSEKEDDGVIKIRFFTMQLRPTFDDYFHEVIKDFEKLHPGVKIKWLDQPFENYETKLITSFIGKNAPDVLNLGSEMIPTFAHARFINEVESLVSPETLEIYVPSLLETGCKLNGEVYAFPWYLSTGVTMCNKAIFEEAGIPITNELQYIDNLEKICKTISQDTNKFAFFPIYTESFLRDAFVTVGIDLVDETRTKATFNSPKAVKVLKFWTDLYRNGIVPREALTASHRRPIELFKTGRLAMLNSGPQFLKHVKSDSPDVYNNTFVLPQITWKDHPVYKIEMHVLAVSAESKHPVIAAEFAAFVTNLENQIKFCKLTTILPSASEGLKDPMFTEVEDTADGQARKISAEQVRKGMIFYPPPKVGKFLNILNESSEKICLGKMEAKEGLDIAERRINDLLGK